MHDDHLLESFVHHLRGEQASAITIRQYAYSIRLYLSQLAKDSMPPCEATRTTVQRYLMLLRARGRCPATLAAHQNAIRKFHAFLGGANPIERRVRLRTGRRLPQFLSEGDTRRLIESVADRTPLEMRDRALLELLYATGLRAAEVLGLRLADLDVAGRTARVMGKGSQEAIVYFGETAAEWLARYLARARPVLAGFEAHGALWVNVSGGPLRYAGLHRMLRERGKQAHVGYVRPHMLRHSFATHITDHGAPIRVVQELMRHASITSTQIYIHVDRQKLAEERRRYHPRG